MELKLDVDEAELLRRVIDRALREVRSEITHTENYEWRQSLHADEERMKSLLARLPKAPEPA